MSAFFSPFQLLYLEYRILGVYVFFVCSVERHNTSFEEQYFPTNNNASEGKWTAVRRTADTF